MRLQKLRVEDLMTTALITMKANDTVRAAIEETRLANIRHVPVVGDREHLIGIISDRDLARAAAAGRLATPLSEIMTRDVKVVRASAPARNAAAVLIAEKIGSLPVIGERGELVGIITETDFLEVARRALGGDAED
jgi:CBS domain-containing protein